MVYSLIAGSTLLRTQRALPQTFCRYKSITAAIERGRQGAPDRFSGSRRRTSVTEARDAGDTRLKTRREARFERFGPPRDDPPPKARDEGVAFTRSSPFSSDRPTRARESAPDRFREDRAQRDQYGPPRQRRDDGFESRPPRNSYRRSDAREKKSADPFSEGTELSNYQEQGRKFRKDRFEHRDERGAPPQRQWNRTVRPERSRRDESSSYAPRQRDSTERPERSGRDESSSYAPRQRDSTERPERSRRDESSSYAPRQRDSTDERPPESRFVHRPDSKGARRQFESRSSRGADVEAPQAPVRGPESLPYTTAASEFIYGHSSVLSALKANRRKLYNLYVHPRGANRDGLMSHIRAEKLFSITQEVGDEYMRAMDKASNGRPHNGVILEASALPVPPITELKAASLEDESFSVTLDSQSAEDALVNGKQEVYSYKSDGWRHPLILYVDGVLDEGNLGAIARSAYFLGVEAIVTPTRQSAPWSHIALKASAGAAEAIPIFKVGEPTDFLGKSSRAGWRIYASDAVPAAPSISDSTSETPEDADGKVVYTIAKSRKRLPVNYSPVAEHPTILMMGAEGTGLRTSLLNMAFYKVGIPHGRQVDEIGVDSLNVSVAASLLCYDILQKPKAQPAKSAEEVLF